MNTYDELKNKWMQDELSKLFAKYKVFFAFSKKQFDEGLANHGISKDEKLAEVVGGGVIPSKNSKAFYNDFEALHENLKKEIKKLDPVIVIEYELSNYEAYYTGDLQDAFEVLKDYDYTIEQVRQVYNDTFEAHNQ